jgi:hypothetical protein
LARSVYFSKSMATPSRNDARGPSERRLARVFHPDGYGVA